MYDSVFYALHSRRNEFFPDRENGLDSKIGFCVRSFKIKPLGSFYDCASFSYPSLRFLDVLQQ
jgi:hypothetical protein